jgi:hypothetical protein
MTYQDSPETTYGHGAEELLLAALDIKGLWFTAEVNTIRGKLADLLMGVGDAVTHSLITVIALDQHGSWNAREIIDSGYLPCAIHEIDRLAKVRGWCTEYVSARHELTEAFPHIYAPLITLDMSECGPSQWNLKRHRFDIDSEVGRAECTDCEGVWGVTLPSHDGDIAEMIRESSHWTITADGRIEVAIEYDWDSIITSADGDEPTYCADRAAHAEDECTCGPCAYLRAHNDCNCLSCSPS